MFVSWAYLEEEGGREVVGWERAYVVAVVVAVVVVVVVEAVVGELAASIRREVPLRIYLVV